MLARIYLFTVCILTASSHLSNWCLIQGHKCCYHVTSVSAISDINNKSTITGIILSIVTFAFVFIITVIASAYHGKTETVELKLNSMLRKNTDNNASYDDDENVDCATDGRRRRRRRRRHRRNNRRRRMRSIRRIQTGTKNYGRQNGDTIRSKTLQKTITICM